MASQRLDQVAAELDAIATWLAGFGDAEDKAAVVVECAARDLRAACWLVKPNDHSLPEGWLAHRRMAG
jgi:hypothetical protein